MLSDDARAVIAGLAAEGVNSHGIMASDAVWLEIRQAFPRYLFTAWATEGNYVEEAGE
ncbi:MAG: hypothetical protein ACREP9_06670 [Candidatus Dormibacteraceae bacterium]